MALSDILYGGLNLLDLPGSAFRDIVTLQNPLDQFKDPFGYTGRQTGRDVLRKWGVISNQDTVGNAMGGTIVEMALDPLNLLGIGAMGKGAKAATRAMTALGYAAPVVASGIFEANKEKQSPWMNALATGTMLAPLAIGGAHSLSRMRKTPKAAAPHPQSRPLIPIDIPRNTEDFGDVLKAAPPHTMDDLRNVANGTGNVTLYHGTPSHFANKIVNEGFQMPESGEEAARMVAAAYGIPWTEWKHRVSPGSVDRGYGSSTARISSAPPATAVKWASHFPQGEVLSEMDADARMYLEAKRRGVPIDDLIEQSGGGNIFQRPDNLGLPSKLSGSGTGNLIAFDADARAIGRQTRRQAQSLINAVDRGDISPEEALAHWNNSYRDIKIHPKHARNPRIVSQPELSFIDDTYLGRQQPTGPHPYVTPEQRDENFKHWFGNSHVIDKDGNPLTVYHGTSADFDTFDNSMIGKRDSGYFGKGHYLAGNPTQAEMYSGMWTRDPAGANIKPVMASLQNPYIIDLKSGMGELSGLQSEDITDLLKSRGHDGIIVNHEGGHKEYVAFEPTQIKSTSNRGTFDPTNPNILMSMAGPALGSSVMMTNDENDPKKTALAAALFGAPLALGAAGAMRNLSKAIPEAGFIDKTYFDTPRLTYNAPERPLGLPAPTPAFYSRLERAVQSLPDKPIKVESLINLIKKAPGGVSEAEIEYALKPIIRTSTSRKTITKGEVLGRLRDTGIEMRSTELPRTKWNVDIPDYATDRTYDMTVPVSSEGEAYMMALIHNRQPGITRKAKSYGTQVPAKWQKESVPLKNGAKDPTYREHVASLIDNYGREIYYHDPHWREIRDPEYHIRYNDVIDPDTKEKFLNIQELQSGRHQDGESEGYRGEPQKLNYDRNSESWRYGSGGQTGNVASYELGEYDNYDLGQGDVDPGRYVREVLFDEDMLQNPSLYGLTEDAVNEIRDYQTNGYYEPFDSVDDAHSWVKSLFSKEIPAGDLERDSRAARTPFSDRRWAERGIREMVDRAVKGGYAGISFNRGTLASQHNAGAGSSLVNQLSKWYEGDLPSMFEKMYKKHKPKRMDFPEDLADIDRSIDDARSVVGTEVHNVAHGNTSVDDSIDRIVNGAGFDGDPQSRDALRGYLSSLADGEIDMTDAADFILAHHFGADADLTGADPFRRYKRPYSTAFRFPESMKKDISYNGQPLLSLIGPALGSTIMMTNDENDPKKTALAAALIGSPLALGAAAALKNAPRVRGFRSRMHEALLNAPKSF